MLSKAVNINLICLHFLSLIQKSTQTYFDAGQTLLHLQMVRIYGQMKQLNSILGSKQSRFSCILENEGCKNDCMELPVDRLRMSFIARYTRNLFS